MIVAQPSAPKERLVLVVGGSDGAEAVLSAEAEINSSGTDRHLARVNNGNDPPGEQAAVLQVYRTMLHGGKARGPED